MDEIQQNYEQYKTQKEILLKDEERILKLKKEYNEAYERKAAFEKEKRKAAERRNSPDSFFGHKEGLRDVVKSK